MENNELKKVIQSERDFIDDKIVRLADVLMIIEEKFGNKYILDMNGDFRRKDTKWNLVNWNLTNNNLDHQSDECKKFLIDLLVK